jgi:hypothetical protein
MTASPRATVLRQARVLAGAFLLRFFENESMATATDLREGFFWLIAALATPGIFLPLYMYFRWAEVAAIHGVPALQAQVLIDKTIYLGLTFVSVGLLAAVIWQSLLIERRDGLILGSLPVRARTVILGKLAALAAYAGLIALGMHIAATLLYGFGLSSLVTFAFLLRFLAGQFLAAAGANAFVFGTVVGLQSLGVAVFGPRRFVRLSSVLQIIVIGSTTALLLLLPVMMTGAITLAKSRANIDSALLWMPPMWFVGLNEVISGTTFAVMPLLAARAAGALAIVTAIVAVTYPIAAWRTMSASVGGNASSRTVWSRAVAGRLARRLGRDQYERGIAQFTLSAIARSHQHRLILMMACGVAVTMTAPAILMYVSGTNVDIFRHYWDRDTLRHALSKGTIVAHYLSLHPAHVSVSLVAAPLLVNLVAASGLRVAMAIPSELAASWPFTVSPAPMLAGRNIARRVMVLASVALPLALAVPLWLAAFGWRHALPLVIASVLGMLTIVEGMLWGFVGIPCTKPMTTGRSNLMSRWPLLLLLLYFYGYIFPSFQVGISVRPGPLYILIPPVLIWLAVRRGSESAAVANGLSGDPHGHISLNLSTPAAPASGVRTRHA